MRAAIRLGLRLFWSTPEQRRRSLLVILATAFGELAMLVVFAVAAAELNTPIARTNATDDLARLVVAIVLAISLPVLTLTASVARFSASLRDRRLANLRLLGLSAARTRVVAAVETGVGAVAGTGVGVVIFLVARPALARISVGGWAWSTDAFMPAAAGWFLAVLAVPLFAGAVAALPQRLSTAAAVATARRADRRRPTWWRVAPLLVGAATCLVISSRTNSDEIDAATAYTLMGAMAMTGVGVLLVVPVFVRLLADLMVRLSRRPGMLVAARRMQAQPAGVSRVVAALMVGLFVVAGARLVLAAFESTPQYVQADRAIHVQQLVSTQVPVRKVAAVRERARRLPGVRRIAQFESLTAKYRLGAGSGVGMCSSAPAPNSPRWHRGRPGARTGRSAG